VPAPSYSARCYRNPRDLHSFPTRRSSDLVADQDHARVPRLALPLGELLGLVDLLGESAPTTTARAAKMSCGTTVRCCGSAASKRSEEHTSELQSRENLVCRLLLEKKKWKI